MSDLEDYRKIYEGMDYYQRQRYEAKLEKRCLHHQQKNNRAKGQYDRRNQTACLVIEQRHLAGIQLREVLSAQ